MKKNYINFLRTLLFFFATAIYISTNCINAQTTQTFTYTGASQNFTVPSCVSALTITARGAEGSDGTNAPGGLGGSAKGIMTVTPGQVLAIYVGGHTGFNGGGTVIATAGNGGGASDVRILPAGLADRVIVAGGGGGGGGGNNGNALGGNGGGGIAVGANFVGGATGEGFPLNMGTDGGTNGGTGGTGNGNRGGSGGGGGFLSGGGGGTNTGYPAGGTGALGIGGNGGGPTAPAGGAGGGGYYGGGGSSAANNNAGGGGGGSSWTGTLTSPSFTAGNQSGNGVVIITYSSNGSIVTVSANTPVICAGSGVTLTASSVLSYTWSNSSNASSITPSPSSNTSYTVQGTNSSGCISEAIITVSVNTAVPSLTVSGNTPSTCFGNTIILTATGALTYTWSNGIINAVTYTPTIPGVNNYTVQGSNACGTSSLPAVVNMTLLPLTITPTSTLICAAKPATLTAGGATTYSWLPGTSTASAIIVNPTATSTYTLRGKAGVCTTTVNFTLNVDPNPTITIAPSSTAVCEGDAVVLTAGGGVSYTWSPGSATGQSISVSPALSSLYTVTGINNVNCTGTAGQVIVVNAKPVLTAAASDTLVCKGGASTLSVTGADTYLWSDNSIATTTTVNPLVTTVYSVTGTSTALCSSTETIAVNVFAPVISVSSSSAICKGTPVNLTASGMDSYIWSNGLVFATITLTPNATATYTVDGFSTLETVTCTSSGTVTITVNPNPTVTAVSATTVICLHENAVLNGQGAVTYTWAGTNPTVSPNLTVSPLADQAYTVLGEDANGCKGKGTILILVSECLGISNNTANAANLAIFPNPSNGEFIISADQPIDLQLTNELGQLVKTISLSSIHPEEKVNGLAGGVYFITGSDANGSVRKKIVIYR